MKKQKIKLSTTHIILLSFFIAILAGTLLLMLPVSSADGESAHFSDALFTATTATCVTGLVTVPTVSSWSVFGHIVILVLIQIGGLGIITVMAGVALLLHRKMGLSDTVLIQDAFNLNTLSGLGNFIKKVILGTFVVEGVGALLYMTVFVPEFGVRGVWISVFNSVSAFCNAGIDIISENSLSEYVSNPVVNFTTCFLIIFGGLGFIVWWDIARVMKKRTRHPFRFLTLHSKIALCVTSILLLSGTVLFLILEYDNQNTLGTLSLFDKLQASFFQSTTLRTAGFATIPQENFTDASAFVSLVFMFVGGSPVGCAGGVKTVTIAVLIATAAASVRSRNDASLFNRRISKETVLKALAVVMTSLAIVFLSAFILLVKNAGSFIDVLYEAVSATATVGLSRGITSSFDTFSKVVVCFTMYFGRVGPISLALSFASTRKKQNIIENPVEDVSVG